MKCLARHLSKEFISSSNRWQLLLENYAEPSCPVCSGRLRVLSLSFWRSIQDWRLSPHLLQATLTFVCLDCNRKWLGRSNKIIEVGQELIKVEDLIFRGECLDED